MISTWLFETCTELELTNIRNRIVCQVGYLQRLHYSQSSVHIAFLFIFLSCVALSVIYLVLVML